jgi:hypothetical protein
LQAAGGTIWTEHSPSVTVGEEGQLATKTGGNWSTVFGGQQLTAGVHYMEVEVGGEMSNLLVGIARPGLDTADGKDYYEGKCMDVWFMNANNGGLWGNGKYGDDKYGEFKAGDRIGLLLDLDNHSLLFFKNGEKHGPGYRTGSVTGPVVLAMQMFFEGQSGRVVGAPSTTPVGKQEYPVWRVHGHTQGVYSFTAERIARPDSLAAFRHVSIDASILGANGSVVAIVAFDTLVSSLEGKAIDLYRIDLTRQGDEVAYSAKCTRVGPCTVAKLLQSEPFVLITRRVQ